MRKLILTVLLATSTAMPAMAQDNQGRQRDRGNREASSEQRSEARAARRAERADNSQRAASPQRAENPQRAERERPQVAAPQPSGEQQVGRRRAFEQQGGERRNWGQRRSNNDGMAAALERQQAARAAEQGGLVEQQREYRRDGRSRDRLPIGRAIEQSGARNGQVVVQRGNDGRAQSRYAGSNHRWSNHWRGDRNYDWRNHRNRHRSVYRLSNYWDPYGSSYRRFSIGFSLFPSYYQSNYWLDDPWQYRLPPAYGPYRWVRYYNDALLVNVYSGQVVDVEHNFFW